MQHPYPASGAREQMQHPYPASGAREQMQQKSVLLPPRPMKWGGLG